MDDAACHVVGQAATLHELGLALLPQPLRQPAETLTGLDRVLALRHPDVVVRAAVVDAGAGRRGDDRPGRARALRRRRASARAERPRDPDGRAARRRRLRGRSHRDRRGGASRPDRAGRPGRPGRPGRHRPRSRPRAGLGRPGRARPRRPLAVPAAARYLLPPAGFPTRRGTPSTFKFGGGPSIARSTDPVGSEELPVACC